MRTLTLILGFGKTNYAYYYVILMLFVCWFEWVKFWISVVLVTWPRFSPWQFQIVEKSKVEGVLLSIKYYIILIHMSQFILHIQKVSLLTASSEYHRLSEYPRISVPKSNTDIQYRTKVEPAFGNQQPTKQGALAEGSETASRYT